LTVALFRCDASAYVGSGHLIRCINLARQLKSRAFTPVFALSSDPFPLPSSFCDEFLYLKTSSKSLSTRVDEHLNDPAYLCELEQDDASETFKLFSTQIAGPVSILILDHYNLSAVWTSCFTQLCLASSLSPPKILVIDDMFDRPQDCHLILDQNLPFASNTFQPKPYFKSKARVISGPMFALISPEYSLMRPITPFRTKLRRIFIYFGSCDPLGLTFSTLKALNHPDFSELAIDVIKFNDFDQQEHLVAFVKSFPNVHLHDTVSSLAALMIRADLAIGAAGCTAWERCCLHLPSIIIQNGDNQDRNIQALSESGASIAIPHDLDFKHHLALSVRKLIYNPAQLFSMSMLSSSITDGLGCQRVADSLC